MPSRASLQLVARDYGTILPSQNPECTLTGGEGLPIPPAQL
jgi:hypothetical protein